MVKWLTPQWTLRDLNSEYIFSKKGFGKSLAQLYDQASLYVEENKHLLSNIPSTRSASRAKHAVVLGGNGFLGAYIVSMFLDQGWQVTVIARNPDRIWLQWKNEPKLEIYKRQLGIGLHLISADLSRKDFAWADEIAPAQCILHSAATLHAFASAQKLESSNIDSLLPAIYLAKKNQAHLQFISTLSSTVSSNGPAIAQEVPLPNSADWWIYGGYAQTKAQAELILSLFPEVSYSILRLGLLVPVAGQEFSDEHAFQGFWNALRTVGTLPSCAENAWVDVTPVDRAAWLAIEIASKSLSGIFHWANPSSLSLENFTQAAQSHIDFKCLEADVWQQKVERSNLSSFQKSLLLSAFSKSEFLHKARTLPVLNADLFQSTWRKFEIENSCKLLPPLPSGKCLANGLIESLSTKANIGQ